MRTVLKILREDAKDWWYHILLRKQGREKEARGRERECIRDSVRALREAVCFEQHTTGARPGFLILRNGFISGGALSRYKECCKILGIPIIEKE